MAALCIHQTQPQLAWPEVVAVAVAVDVVAAAVQRGCWGPGLDKAPRIGLAEHSQLAVLAAGSPEAAAGSQSVARRIAAAAVAVELVGTQFAGIALALAAPSAVGFARSSQRSQSGPRGRAWLVEAGC